MAADLVKFRSLFYIENFILDEAILMRHTIYLHTKENRKYISIMPPDLAL